ncbi:MAG TPA: hypothetical protein VH540_08650 [Ktedonobacterales bacterium]|jgi:hypothetical protein
MQQICSNCRYPLQPGTAVCTNCGTPVSASGGGSYDPTIRAGSPPGAGYGQSPYGAPTPSDPYSGQYSAPQGSPYGASQPNPYGAPQPNPYGAPQPGPYGTPQANQFGGPGAPVFTPVAPKRSRRGILFVAIGIIVACIVVVVAFSAFSKFKQVITTGSHITKIQVGTGQDPNTFEVTGVKDTFDNDSTVYVSFTVVTQDANAQIVLKLYAGSDLQDSTDSVTPDVGTSVYGNSAVVHKTGEHTFEVDYNGTKEATITFNVT